MSNNETNAGNASELNAAVSNELVSSEEKDTHRPEYLAAFLITGACSLVLILLVVHSYMMAVTGMKTEGVKGATISIITIILAINIGGVLATTLKPDNKLAIAVIGLLGTIIGAALQ